MRIRSLITASLSVAAVAATGCGDDSVRTACVGLDATNPAIDGAYMDEFHRVLDAAARDEINIRVLLFRGDPLSEGRIIAESFEGLGPPELRAERRQRINRVRNLVDDQLVDMRAGIVAVADGSAVIDALGVLTTRRQVCSVVDLYSDGLERARFSVYDDPITSQADRDRITQALRAANAMSSLGGLVVRMPYGGFVMGSSRLSRERKGALEPLWDTLIEGFGGELEWGT